MGKPPSIEEDEEDFSFGNRTERNSFWIGSASRNDSFIPLLQEPPKPGDFEKLKSWQQESTNKALQKYHQMRSRKFTSESTPEFGGSPNPINDGGHKHGRLRQKLKDFATRSRSKIHRSSDVASNEGRRASGDRRTKSCSN